MSELTSDAAREIEAMSNDPAPEPVSPERLRELILRAFPDDWSLQDDTTSALCELETARARIAELERTARHNSLYWKEIDERAQAAERRIADLEKALAASNEASIGYATELAEHRRDAERYRWLRHGDNDERVLKSYPDTDGTQYIYLPRNKELDVAIDAALAAQGERDE